MLLLILDGSDYIGDTEYIYFPASGTRACGRFAIINNNVQEQFEETFSVCIDSATPGLDIISGNATTIVVIQDDDSELGINTMGMLVTLVLTVGWTLLMIIASCS